MWLRIIIAIFTPSKWLCQCLWLFSAAYYCSHYKPKTFQWSRIGREGDRELQWRPGCYSSGTGDAISAPELSTDTCWEQIWLYEISNMWALRDTQGLSSRKGVRHGFLHTCLKEDLVPGEGQWSRISAITVGRDRRTELRRRGKDRGQLGCNDNTGERIVDLLANTEGKSQLFRVTTGSKIWCPLCAETSGSC